MSAIAELIDKRDNSEVVRDEIAAILVTELATQQALASGAGKDPTLWSARVFAERANPWAEFLEAPEQADGVPLVNVSLDNVNYDASSSNAVERQKATAVYHLDCYGYGISEDDGGTGHIPGDARASLDAQRAVRLVRNILMAGTYTYLGLRGLVWRRWIQSVSMFQPALESRAVQQIVAARIALQVDFNEFSPQVIGEPMELLSATVFREGTGEVFLQATYEYDS